MLLDKYTSQTQLARYNGWCIVLSHIRQVTGQHDPPFLGEKQDVFVADLNLAQLVVDTYPFKLLPYYLGNFGVLYRQLPWCGVYRFDTPQETTLATLGAASVAVSGRT